MAVAIHRVLEIDRPRERILLDTSAVNIDGLGLEVGYADAASVALSLSVLDQPALESVRLFRVDGPQEARMNAAALVDLVPGTSAEAPFSFFPKQLVCKGLIYLFYQPSEWLARSQIRCSLTFWTLLL